MQTDYNYLLVIQFSADSGLISSEGQQLALSFFLK